MEDRDGKSATMSEQETTYSAVVVNDHTYVSLSLPISFYVSMTLSSKKLYRDRDTVHYNCTIGSFLFCSLLLIYNPFPS